MLFDTGVHIDEGDIFTIISTHFEPVMIAVGENSKTMVPATYFIRAECSGELRLGIMQVHAAVDYGSKINMDIFVWEKEDYIQINNYLVKLKELNPKNKQINYILDEVAVYLDRKANNLRRDAERKAHDY